MSASTFISIVVAIGFVIALISIIIHFYQKSRGKVTVIPDKYNFTLGEKVTGKVFVELKKPITGSKLTVSLIAQRRSVRPNVSYNQMRSSDQRTQQVNQTVYSFEMPLDGEKEYSQGEYPFEINIPQSVPGMQSGVNGQPEGVAGQVIGAITQLNAMTGGAMMGSRIDWNLHAQLYVPGKIDIRGKTQINVG